MYLSGEWDYIRWSGQSDGQRAFCAWHRPSGPPIIIDDDDDDDDDNGGGDDDDDFDFGDDDEDDDDDGDEDFGGGGDDDGKKEASKDTEKMVKTGQINEMILMVAKKSLS